MSTHERDRFTIAMVEEVDLFKKYETQLIRSLSRPNELIPTVYYYDDEGSRIFTQLCEDPAYYLTRTETKLLSDNAMDIARLAGDRHIIEFGSGNARKTRLLLQACGTVCGDVTYSPIDVNRSIIEDGAQDLLSSVSNLEVRGVVAAYEEGARAARDAERDNLFLFLGSTMAQFIDEDVHKFLDMLKTAARPGDKFLVAFDLYKDPEKLVAGYNAEPAARHQLNALKVINRQYEGDFDASSIRSYATWNADEYRVEMFYEFVEPQQVAVKKLGFEKYFPAGYVTSTHIMRKMTPQLVVRLIESAGLRLDRTWRDRDTDYGLFLFSI